MQATSAFSTATHRLSCLHQRPRTCLSRNRSAPRVRVRSVAEQVYKVESQLVEAGFTQSQARSLLVTGSRLSEIRRKANFKQIRSVFEASWEIEDELMQHGMDLKKARHVGCMFVALAATQLEGKRNSYNTEAFWRFWELSALDDAGNSLEAAGAPQYTGYKLASSILNFFVLNRENDKSK